MLLGSLSAFASSRGECAGSAAPVVCRTAYSDSSAAKSTNISNPLIQLTAMTSLRAEHRLTTNDRVTSDDFAKFLKKFPKSQRTFWEWAWWSGTPSTQLLILQESLRALSASDRVLVLRIISLIEIEANNPETPPPRQNFLNAIVRISRLELHDFETWRELLKDLAAVGAGQTRLWKTFGLSNVLEFNRLFRLGLAEACRRMPEETADKLKPVFEDLYGVVKFNKKSAAIRALVDFARMTFKTETTLIRDLERGRVPADAFKDWLRLQNELFTVKISKYGDGIEPEQVLQLLKSLRKRMSKSKFSEDVDFRILGSMVNGRGTDASDLDIDSEGLTKKQLAVLEKRVRGFMRSRRPYGQFTNDRSFLDSIPPGSVVTNFYKAASPVQVRVSPAGIWISVNQYIGQSFETLASPLGSPNNFLESLVPQFIDTTWYRLD